MTKPNKLFSWLGLGKKSEPEVATPTSAPKSASAPSADQQSSVHVLDNVSDTSKELNPVNETADEHKVAEHKVAEHNQITTVTDIPPMQMQSASKPEDGVADIAVVEVTQPAITQPVVTQPAILPSASVDAVATDKKPGFFARLKQGLAKTSQSLGNGLASLFLGKKIDDDLYEELETQLLMADVGVDTTQKLIKQLVAHADRKQLKDADSLYEKLQAEMALLLDKVEQPLQIDSSNGPYVILMVGVNGVGKTTTIGKMAQQFKQQGKTVMLAAGDTFRAAAVEQLQVWGERNQIPVIAQHSGADSASVIFDAYQAAKARKVDVLIADTAGRLQNKAHLMEELKKIVRVMKKIDDAAPHEVMLTLDAGTGQNALSQAKLFHEAVQLTGISLTKLDGTAKGGVIFAIADQFALPIRYIGVGEGIDDLRVFHSQDFIRALFNKEF